MFKKIFILLIFSIVLFTSCSTIDESWAIAVPYTIAPNDNAKPGEVVSSLYKTGWELTFSDEFDGPVIDESVWKIITAEEDARYHENNVYQKNGNLILAVNSFDEYGNRSGRIDSRDSFLQKYGVFECRAKLDIIEDTIFAFWMTNYPGVNSIGNDGSDGAEIDIIETGYQDASVVHTLHWDGYEKEHKMHSTGKISSPTDIHNGYHIYGIEWTEESIHFFVDGILTAVYTGEGIPQIEEFLILSSQIQSHWEGNIKNATLPLEYTVDWIRVYAKK